MMEKEVGGRIKTTESSFRKSVNILLPFLIYFVVHDLAQVLLIFLVHISMAAWDGAFGEMMAEKSATVNGFLNALSLLIGMAAVWPMAYRELKWAKVWARGSGSADRDGRGRKIAEYGLLIITAISFALGVNMLFALLGLTGVSESYQEVAERQYGVAFGMGLLIYGVISPLAEETVFRGLIYNRMRRYFGRAISVIACGVMFGIYHGNLVQGIYGCILGIAITWSYEHCGSFLAPVLFHAAANAAVFAVGYDGIVRGNIVTPLNCAVFLGISMLGVVASWRLKHNL